MLRTLKKVAIFAALPFMLVGCVGEKKAKNLLEANIKTLARDQGDLEVGIPILDRAHYDNNQNLVHYVKFKADAKVESYSLEGGLKGKQIKRITMTEGEPYAVFVWIVGKCSDDKATEGEIVIKPEALDIQDKEYEGFTFYVTIELAEKTEHKSII